MKVGPRARQITFLLGQGLTYGEIGKQLGLSHWTVAHYAQRAARRLKGPGGPRDKLLRYYHRDAPPKLRVEWARQEQERRKRLDEEGRRTTPLREAP